VSEGTLGISGIGSPIARHTLSDKTKRCELGSAGDEIMTRGFKPDGQPRRSKHGLEVTCKPPARKVAPRCVHMGCAELQASGLWMVQPEDREPKLDSKVDATNSHVDGSAK
jgi:hypothetical protein